MSTQNQTPDAYQLSNWETSLLEIIANYAIIPEDQKMFTQSAEEIPFQISKLYRYIRNKRMKLLAEKQEVN